MTSLLPCCYLAPIEYYSVLLKSPSVIFEVHEHFVKQTYRNRCEIYGANGKLNLIIPVKHTGERTPMKEVKTSNESNWQKIHWRSFQAAYRTSSYFEFYEHIFVPYYEKKYEFLIDFNFALHAEILKILEAPPPKESDTRTLRSHRTQPSPLGRENVTSSYQKKHTGVKDFRNYFSPKPVTSNQQQVTSYHQVFADKFGFIPNLSIVDLIFNAGPEAKEELAK